MWNDFKNWLHRRHKWMEANFWECIAALFIFGFLDAYVLGIFIDKKEISIVEWIASLITISGLFLLARRTQYQSKQIDDQMFNSAVALLGSSKESARTGAIYSLYHLAWNNRQYRVQIAQILCSHIRSLTQEEEYIEKNRVTPSNEIQTAINLLFKDVFGQKGLYYQFQSELPRANLSFSYLVGVDFHLAYCQGVYFEFARCMRAIFSDAECQGAIFNRTLLQGADFEDAKCQGTVFHRAQCLSTHFFGSQCQGADFSHVKCKNADFHGANFEGAYAREGAYRNNLAERVDRHTELKTMASDSIDNDGEFVKFIEKVINDEKVEGWRAVTKKWCEQMQKLIDEHKEPQDPYKAPPPPGIKTGILKNSKELSAIIVKLKKIDEWEREV